MDPMDIDSIMEVPDTPDRLIAKHTKGKNVERESNDKARIVVRSNDNGSRKSWSLAPRSPHGSSSAAAAGNSFSNNSSTSKRLAPSYETGHSQCAKSDNLQNNLSFAPLEGSVEVLSEKNIHVNKGKKIVSCGRPGGSQVLESGKNLPFAVQLRSQQSVSDSKLASRINYGSESTNAVSAFNRGKGVESNAITPPNVVTGKKRLVRNGCISPCNIAKAQPIDVMDVNGTIGDGPSHTLRVSSSRSQAGGHARVPAADAQPSSVSKGKEIMTNPFSVENPGGQNEKSRDTVSINEIIEDDDNSNKRTYSSLGDFSGWRSPHNRSKKTSFSSEEHQRFPLDHSSSLTCSASPPMLPLRQRLHLVRSQSNQHNGVHPVTDMIQERQKQGSSSSIQDGSSQRTSDDSGIIFLGSSGDAIESRPTRSRRRNRVNILERVIEIDEGNSGVRGDGSVCASSSNSEDAMARQVEADAMLARELQEQLYSEDLGVTAGEHINVHEALDLQHENMQHAYPRGIPHAAARRSSTANTSRPPVPRVVPSINVSRTGTQARSSIRSRMNRLRNQFPGRARTLSSREGSSLFPPGMDVDLRMSILETLEAFNDMGVDNNFLEIHREFNENDYEMLLGLDENNHRHSGASTSRINNLPQSTVQNNNLEETCTVCLETPTTGDVIRHLPCLHMFHKDCIDPWLRRKSSCPVCKCSVT